MSKEDLDDTIEDVEEKLEKRFDELEEKLLEKLIERIKRSSDYKNDPSPHVENDVGDGEK